MSSTVEFVEAVEARLRPLELELAQAWWQSNTDSSPAADERRIDAELARSALLADGQLFAEIRAARDSAEAAADPLLRRRLDILHDAFEPQQVPPEQRRAIVELATRVESTFNNFR